MTSPKPQQSVSQKPKNWVGLKAKTTPNVGWTRLLTVNREEILGKGSGWKVKVCMKSSESPEG